MRITGRLACALALATIMAIPPAAAEPAKASRAKAYGANISLRMQNALAVDDGRPPLLQPKVFGGRTVPVGSDPWQVALIMGLTDDPERIPFCGGSLVAPQWVLTAAHCVDNGTEADAVDVVVGHTNIDKGRRVEVDAIYVRPDWVYGPIDDPIFHNDAALLHLSRPVTDGRTITPVATVVAGTANLRVSGWGATETSKGEMVRDLKAAGVKSVTNKQCNDDVAYGDGNAATPDRITPGMLCAGFAEGGTDSCEGDSGGPLTMAAADRRVLVGIVSWGDGCAEKNKFGVYTRLSEYQRWVADCIDGKPCPKQ